MDRDSDIVTLLRLSTPLYFSILFYTPLYSSLLLYTFLILYTPLIPPYYAPLLPYHAPLLSYYFLSSIKNNNL